MLNRIFSALAEVRRRPIAHRRVLGVATYIGVSFVVLALGLTSLRSALTLAPAAAPSKENGYAGDAAPKREDITGLISPLQSLKEGLAETVAGAKRILAGAGEPDSEGKISAPDEYVDLPVPSPLTAAAITTAKTAPVPKSEAAPKPEVKKEKAADRPAGKVNASPLPAPQVTGLGEKIAKDLTPSANDFEETARLVRPPANATAAQTQRAKSGFSNEMADIISYNLGEIKRAASDLYKYFTE